MLYRAAVQDVKSGRVSKKYGYLIVVMQFYPRGLSKERVDESIHELAPDRKLFTEFKSKERLLKDHNQAFVEVDYERRFVCNEEGLRELKRVAELSQERDVYLICQCGGADLCHGDLLLLIASQQFHAKIPLLRHRYSVFRERLEG
jgi:uncharacterized protein YeaO (DUF488 family)